MLEETESIMRRNDAVQILQEQSQALMDCYPISALFLFGSVARDEAREDSDVDLLVEFSHPIGLFQLIALKEDLEALLGRRVDIGTRRSLKPEVKGRVLQEAIRIF
jgi:predicted nucleotidyltransferase